MSKTGLSGNLAEVDNMPSLDLRTARCEATYEKIQESIIIIESLMGSEEEAFTFNFQDAVLSLASLDRSAVKHRISTIMDILIEYKKMLKNEKSRRRLARQITT